MTPANREDPRLPEPTPLYRWTVLIFISLAMFGNYYVYDSMAPVFDLLTTQLEFTDQQKGLLYSAYSVAAVLVLLAGGYIIDRWGTKKSITLFAAILYWILEKRAEGRYSLGEVGETERIEKGALYKFSASYWYIVALCVVFYSTVFPFRAFAIDYFQQAHGLQREAAGMLSSFLPISAMIATPLFGLLVDRVGRRSFFMAVGSLVLLPLFLVVTYAPPGPGIALGTTQIPLTLLMVMIMLGIAFSLIPAVMWPSVAYIVEQRRLGTGYALMTLCQQVGMAIIPWLIGFTNDLFDAGPENPAGYAGGMWIFPVLASLGLFFSFMLWKTERGPGGHGIETITTKTGMGGGG